MYRQRLSLVALVLLLAVPAFAQKFSSSVRGTVTDPTGAAVANAKVTITNEGTNVARTLTTNSAGNYSLGDAPVGSYKIEVEVAGFKTAVQNKVNLSVSEVREVDFKLETGNVTEIVSVEANPNAVRTVGADISGLVSGDQVRELPLNGRNFMQLTMLQPGVTALEGLNTKDKGLSGGADMSVSGGTTTSNLWLVDGADNVDHGSNRTILVYPSVDAIEEFKIQRNNYGAEFGGAGGAQVNLVTRGGTNSLHGSLYSYFRRDALNSNEYFLKVADKEKPGLTWNDFGATLGGPIIKDKLHFFLSWEMNQDKRTETRTGFVPTANERVGNFNYDDSVQNYRVPGCTPANGPNDPATGKPYAGNQMTGNLSQGGQDMLNLMPLPNTKPTGGSCINYTESVKTPVDWSQLHARVDWSLANNTRIMVRYTQDSWKATNTNQNLWGDDPYPAVGSTWNQPGRSLVAQLNNTIGSSMTNTLTFSYSANRIEVTRDSATGIDANAYVAKLNQEIPTAYCASATDSRGAGQACLPTTDASGAVRKQRDGEAQPGTGWGPTYPYNGGNPLWNQAPWLNNQDLFVIKDDYSAVFGSHFIKAGILYSYNKKNEEPSNTSAEAVNLQGWGASAGVIPGYDPSMSLAQKQAAYKTGSATGNPVGDFLYPGAVWGTAELTGNYPVEQRWSDIEFYIADSIKLGSRLTADIGLRVSHMSPPWEASDNLANFNNTRVDDSSALGYHMIPSSTYDPNNSSPCNGMQYPTQEALDRLCTSKGFTGGQVGENRYLRPYSTLFWGPRLGLAWDVFGTGKTAVRGGFGIFYNRERMSAGLGVGQNPPIAGNANLNRTLDSTDAVSGSSAPGYGAPGNAYEQISANTHAYQWNVSVQQELWKNTVLELAYVGNKGLDLVGQINLNETPGPLNQAGSPNLRRERALYGTDKLKGADGTSCPGGQCYAAPLVDDATGKGYNGQIALWGHGRTSIYHGLQAALTSRFGQGSVLSLAYTYAKVLSDTGISNADGLGLSSNNAYTDSEMPWLDRARGGNDRTHVFSGSLVLGLPKFEDKHPFIKHVFGDWEATSIVQWGTGYPVTVTGGAANLNSLYGTGNNSDRPDRAYDASGNLVPCSVTRTNQTQYLNPDAWTVNGHVIGTNGNSQRNSCDGPSIFQMDASIYKNIHLGSRVKVQLRLEIFNIFNTLNFRADSLGTGWNATNTVFEDANGNVVAADSPARYKIQSATPSQSFGQFGNARDPRTMQLGIRLTF